MHACRLIVRSCILGSLIFLAIPVGAQIKIATTTLNVSICGDSVVNDGEQCDVPGEIGAYSTSIAGRQCSAQCQFGPYCGDAIQQTIYGEECDDGNNTDGDFCAADCTIEPAATGGGKNSGGGSGGSGGSSKPIGDTKVSVTGLGYPGKTINILVDGDEVGSVRASSAGEFTFESDVSPGATTLGFWATDNLGTRSITFTTTFEVTQGAITNVNRILLPPTITLSDATINPGDTITARGQAAPERTVEVYIDNKRFTAVQSDTDGTWEATITTTALSTAEHIVKARYVNGTGSLRSESAYSTALQLFVGVDGRPASNGDLNRDGSVNLIDFSVLIYWWGTAGGVADPSPDINGNGKVGLEDFSILLFNWTG